MKFKFNKQADNKTDKKEFIMDQVDVCVIGAGHAGCEAALACARLGLNTVVFPEAYGGNPETGASMALISHTLCVITIPIMYSVMTLIFGQIL